MVRIIALLSSFFCCIFIGIVVADWNILSQPKTEKGLDITLQNYCESWRINVELHNIREFHAVPDECASYIGKYVTSTQYRVDSDRAIEECRFYLGTCCALKRDGKDAWLFDVDDTLLSTVPYFKKFGGKKLNSTSLEEWMGQRKAPALEHTLRFFNDLKFMGMKIILVSSRRENLRSATIENLVNVGYHGWTSLILRGSADEVYNVQIYKANARKQLISQGYRIWGILGDQYSSFGRFEVLPSALRSFKLPNPMYYVS